MQTTAQTNDSGHVAGGKTEADTSAEDLATFTYRIESGSGYEAEATHKNITPKQYHQVVAALEGTLKEENNKLHAVNRDLVKALQRLMDSDKGIAAASEDDLLAASNEGEPIVREQAAAVLQARAALRKAGVK